MKTIPLEDLTLANISKTDYTNFIESKGVFPSEFNLLEELVSLYKIFFRSFDKKIPREKLPVLSMYMICDRELLISSQLMCQAHFSEAYTLISRASEAVGYAVAMNVNPDKATIWSNKSGQKGFKKLFGKPFPAGDKLLHPVVFGIYNITRDFGSHVNIGSTIHFVSQKAPNKFEFVYCDLNDIKWIKRNLLFTIHSFFEFMVVFNSLFDKELNVNFKNKYNIFFQKWVSYRDTNISGMFGTMREGRYERFKIKQV